jgi:hypothetical protein
MFLENMPSDIKGTFLFFLYRRRWPTIKRHAMYGARRGWRHALPRHQSR